MDDEPQNIRTGEFWSEACRLDLGSVRSNWITLLSCRRAREYDCLA